jgi:hypothetical protein
MLEKLSPLDIARLVNQVRGIVNVDGIRDGVH